MGVADRQINIAWIALLGAVCYWLALPPLNWSWIGWVSLAPWAWVAARTTSPSRRDWIGIWLVSFLMWAGILYFIPIPHPGLWVLYPLMCAYLAIYLPSFIGASHFLIHRCRWPSWVVIPVAWTGLEWIRAHLITGFGMAFLSHTQYRVPWAIQISDLLGAYLLSAVMAMIAALVVIAIRTKQRAMVRAASLVAIGVLLAAQTTYSNWRMSTFDTQATTSAVDAVIIQGSIDTEFPESEAELFDVWNRQFRQYRELTVQARTDFPTTELIIWPETIFPQTLLMSSDNESPTSAIRYEVGSPQESLSGWHRLCVGAIPMDTEERAPFEHVLPLLTGAGAFNLDNNQQFNSAILLNGNGEVVARYDKNHRVIFGEYIPLAEWFPSLNRLSPMGSGLTRGLSPKALVFQDVVFSPSICFESTVPHLIRRHFNELSRAGQEPDCLLNVTNDGWFFGTSCLDLHLACNVFRAVEMRRPMLVAANTGFSADIDSAGIIRQQGPRRDTGVLFVNIRPSSGTTCYRVVGDVLWGVCAGIVVISLAFARRKPNPILQ